MAVALSEWSSGATSATTFRCACVSLTGKCRSGFGLTGTARPLRCWTSSPWPLSQAAGVPGGGPGPPAHNVAERSGCEAPPPALPAAHDDAVLDDDDSVGSHPLVALVLGC